MFDAFITGFFLVFEWPAFGYLCLGILLGIWLGAVPGLGGLLGLIILLPFTFGMDPVAAFALLLGLYAVTTTSDTIASVMLGIPGTAASQATILDGYPMAQKGQAARAFGAAFTVSAFGGVFGALVMAASLPLILPIILAFASPEMLMLGLLGLAMVGSLSGGSMLKGLSVALLGLLMAMVGYAETVAIPRFWFGTDYMVDGLPLIPIVLGLFAIPELMELATKNLSISRIPKDQTEGGGMLEGIKDAFRHWWLALRCSLIGTYVGILPGLGAAIVDWIAYGHAVQSAKDKSQFGQGDIRGVIAPEAANNATKGGALIPTVAFGIPGSIGAAVLLGALIQLGLKPGPEMLTTRLPLTFSMVWMIVVANLIVAILLLFWSKQVAKVAFVPGHVLVPAVIVFVFMGSWLTGASMGDWITCMTMGTIGFFMKRGGWPRPPLILAVILGPLLENSFQISMRSYDFEWLLRTPVMIIMALLVITLILAARGIIKTKQAPDAPAMGEGSEKNPVVSLPFSAGLGILFLWAGLESLQWPVAVKQFPLAITIPGLALVLPIIYRDYRELTGAAREAGSLMAAVRAASEKAALQNALYFLGYLTAIIVGTLVLGQKIVLPIFIGMYLWRWGGYGWRVSVGYAVGGWVFIVGFYDLTLHVFFHPFWLADWFTALMPRWFPAWLII